LAADCPLDPKAECALYSGDGVALAPVNVTADVAGGNGSESGGGGGNGGAQMNNGKGGHSVSVLVSILAVVLMPFGLLY